MTVCRECGRLLTGDEIGANRKLISRGVTEFFCLGCLSRYFGVTEEKIEALIARFKAEGCGLFPPETPKA